MQLHKPFVITPRLLPGIRIDTAFVSIKDNGRSSEGRTRWTVYLDRPGFEEFVDDSLQSGCQGATLQEGLNSWLNFLMAALDSRSYRERTGRHGENENLFPESILGWASDHESEIQCMQLDLEETPNLITY